MHARTEASDYLSNKHDWVQLEDEVIGPFRRAVYVPPPPAAAAAAAGAGEGSSGDGDIAAITSTIKLPL